MRRNFSKVLICFIILPVALSCRSSSSQGTRTMADGDVTGLAGSPLFSTDDVATFELDIPSTGDPMAYAPSTLTYVGTSGHNVKLDIMIKVRGHSSVNEYGFPKRSVKFTQVLEDGSMFSHLQKFKIGTHCGSVRPEPATAPERHNEVLCHENATHREAFVYRMIQELNLPVQKSRPGRIRYILYRPDGAVRETIEADALLLEDADLSKRYRSGDLEDPKDALANISLLNALIGNVDWRINSDPAKNHNIEVIAIDNYGDYLVPSDFDRSSVVTGALMHPNILGPEFASKPHPFRQAAFLLKAAKKSVQTESLARAKAHFEAKKSVLLGLLATYPMDEDGRKNIEAYLENFYQALDAADFSSSQ